MDKLFNNNKSYLIIPNSFQNKHYNFKINSNNATIIFSNNSKYKFNEIINDNYEQLKEITQNHFKNHESLNFIFLNEKVNLYNMNYIFNLISNENNFKEIIFSLIQVNLIIPKEKYIIKNQKFTLDNINQISLEKINFEDFEFILYDFIIFFNDYEKEISYKVYFIYQNYEQILNILSIDKKEKELNTLIERINLFLKFEDILLDKCNQIPLLKEENLNDIENYKNECIEYYSEILNEIEKLKDDLSKGNCDLQKKFDLFLKEQSKFKSFLLNKNEKEISIYKSLIDYYNLKEKNINHIKEDYKDLKQIISQFIYTNNEIIQILKDKNLLNKEIIKIPKLTENEELKNKINILESRLKQKESQIINYSKLSKKNLINNSYSKIHERNCSIEKKKGYKTKEINNLQSQLLNKDKEISNLKQQLSKKEKEIKIMRNKKYEFWKVKNSDTKMNTKTIYINNKIGITKFNFTILNTINEYNRINCEKFKQKDFKFKSDDFTNKIKVKKNNSPKSEFNYDSIIILKKIIKENNKISKGLNFVKYQNNKLENEISKIKKMNYSFNLTENSPNHTQNDIHKNLFPKSIKYRKNWKSISSSKDGK